MHKDNNYDKHLIKGGEGWGRGAAGGEGRSAGKDFGAGCVQLWIRSVDTSL